MPWLRKFREFLLTHKVKAVLVLVAFMLILGGTFIFLESESPSNFNGKNSVAVNAPVEDPGIQFTTEPVKPTVHGENYFVNYRLQREEFRQETKNMLSPLLNSTVPQTKEEAQTKWLELARKIEKESEIENLLKIKGFQDVVADVNTDSVSVIVLAPAISPNEISLIQDIVTRVTKVRLDRISISVRKAG